MNILLIQPKMNPRPMDTDLKMRMSPSWALLTIVQLTPEGHEVRMVNENVCKIDFDGAVDLVGITVTLDVMPRAMQIAECFRARGIPVIAGGVHVTCCPQSCAPHFDAVCVGPAERVWARVIADAACGRLQSRYEDVQGFTGEEIVSPCYDMPELKSYLFSNIVLTSRGCPNRCDFCYNSCANRLYVHRPITDVLQDIDAIRTRHVLFVDDNFIGDTAYTRALLQAMLPLNLKWGAAVTTKIVDHPELLDLMAQSGCQCLFIGFESINRLSLSGVHKGNQVKEYDRLVREIHRRGIMINASMVFGLDGDEPDVFERTLDWLVSSRISTLTAHIMTPYPGTSLHARLMREGRIEDEDLSKYNTANVVFRPQGMSAEALRRGYLWMYRQFYSLRNIAKRMPRHKATRAPYLMFNLFYRKFGKCTAALARLIPLRVIGKLAAKLSYRT